MQKIFYEEVGKKIKELRRERKLSQKELAQKMGKKTATYINLIESGKRRISLLGLVNVANALDLTLNAFLEKNYESMDTNSLLNLALISDPQLKPEQRETILEFVKFIRKQRKNK